MAQGRTNTAKWIESAQRWQINVQRDGKRRTFTSSTPGRRGQREANRKADEWISGEVISGATPVRKLWEKYENYVKANGSVGTARRTNWVGRLYIIPIIGSIKIDRLTEGNLQEILDRAKKNGLHKTSIQTLRNHISGFVKWMRLNRFCTLHMDDVQTPNAPSGEKKILQPDEIRVLLQSDETMMYNHPVPEPLVYAWRFQCLTGLRPGETLGLRWEDVDGDIIHIRRAINIRGEITTGKNDNARRDIALSSMASAVLAARRERAELDGDPLDGEVFLYDGLPIREDFYYKRFQRYCAHNGIAKVSPYELRHTFVSLMKELPEGYLKRLVGHSRVMDTYGVYSHDMDGDAERVSEMVNSRLLEVLSEVI